ncbi:MAG: T9SS type A sorting domain-containing protein [Phycisphaerae bacterium]|nr:T9SS type A sorting domain-containing protein [Saprospiraceae bacterium]
MNRNTLISIISFAVLLNLPFAAHAIIEITSVIHISAGNNCDGKIDITASGPVGNGIYPCTFEWTGPNGFMATTEDLDKLCKGGIYVVKITFADGSCSVSLSITLVKCNSFQPIQQISTGAMTASPELPDDSFKLFPNPTSGLALLRYGALQPLSLRAFDAAGRMVLEKLDAFEKEETKIETPSFASGIYTLQIVTGQGTATKKLAVLR